jgi:hypothetical protein
VASEDASALLAAESVSAVALCGSLVALGMRSGVTVLFDTSGKQARRPSRKTQLAY